MFVFKAAVVGAGTMGGEIAQMIAAAGIPVVLKDIEQEFVDAGLERPATSPRARSTGSSRRTRSPRSRPPRSVDEILGAHHGHDRPTTASATSTS